MLTTTTKKTSSVEMKIPGQILNPGGWNNRPKFVLGRLECYQTLHVPLKPNFMNQLRC